MQNISTRLLKSPSEQDLHTAQQIRNVRLFNLYRLTVASILLFTQSVLGKNGLSSFDPALTINILSVYFLLSVGAVVLDWLNKPYLRISPPVQIVLDIGFIVLIMHLFDLNPSGVGFLLIITIVFASLISDGRLALFYASVATIGILLEQTYSILTDQAVTKTYTNAALLSVACFATAWLAYTLASRMQISERLAMERGADIASLGRINALITQEMPDGVMIIDSRMAPMHYNIQSCELTGLSTRVMSQAVTQGTPINFLLPEIAGLFQQWAKSDSLILDREASKVTLANRDLGIRFLPIATERLEGAIIFIEDWSQIQTQAHQVKLAALGRLTANIAHEIRNPLSAISHANQLLQEDNRDPATARMLTIIEDNVQRVDQIIKDVLELNRRDRTNQESIPLYPFIQEFYHQFCAVENISTAHFVLKAVDLRQTIYFDRRHINQILWNLCKNGWRHCKKNENSLQLLLLVSQTPSFIDIIIKDDGSGIEPSIQSSLFEPFMTTEKTGTGLGLYIARELAEANGAKLNYITSSQDGTQFTLTVKKV